MKVIAPPFRNQEHLEREFLHTKKRMIERYGLMISRSLYDSMCRTIHLRMGLQGGVYRRNTRYEAWVIWAMGRKIAVSFDTAYEVVASALPPTLIPTIERRAVARQLRKRESPVPPSWPKSVPAPPVVMSLRPCPICRIKERLVRSSGLCPQCHNIVVALRCRPALVPAYLEWMESNPTALAAGSPRSDITAQPMAAAPPASSTMLPAQAREAHRSVLPLKGLLRRIFFASYAAQQKE